MSVLLEPLYELTQTSAEKATGHTAGQQPTQSVPDQITKAARSAPRQTGITRG